MSRHDLVVLGSISAVFVGTLLGAMMRSRYRQPILQIPGYGLGIAGAIVATVLEGNPGILLFGFFPGFLLMNASAQLVMARRMRRARALAGPPLPRPQRVVDLEHPPGPLEIQLVDLAAHFEEAAREWPATPQRRTLPPPPVPILYLWAFEADPRADLISMVRKEFGPVFMLNGGGWLVPDIADLPAVLFSRGGDDRIETTEAEVVQRLSRFRRRQVWGYWPLNAMLCGDAVWQFALDRLIERCPLVVMDLSAYGVGRSGCEFEIGRLIDGVPVNRCLFLVSPGTDRSAVDEVLRAGWSTMARTSPNRASSPGRVRLVRAAHLRDGEGNRAPGPSPRELELRLIAELIREARGIPLPAPRNLR